MSAYNLRAIYYQDLPPIVYGPYPTIEAAEDAVSVIETYPLVKEILVEMTSYGTE